MSSYPLVPIREIAKIHYGKALKAENRVESGSVPVFGSSGQGGFHNESIVDHPTLVIGRKGSVGHVTYAEQGGWAIDTAFYTEFIESNVVSLRFFFYALKRSRLERWTITTSIPGINRDDLYTTQIPLPPIAQQVRIAEILDRADAIRRKRQEAIQLTEELLRSAFLEMFGYPVTNPKRWEIKPLGEIVQFVGGGTPRRDEPKYFEGSICWATSKDMSVDVLSDTEEHITPEAIRSSATKLVEAGCLLVVVKSKILMRRLPVARTIVPTCFGQDVKAIIPQEKWITRYLHRHLKFGEKALLRQARGVNTEGLTLEHLRSYPVMIPTDSLMRNFVDLDIAIENGARTREVSERASDDFFNSLLQRAFRGEL